MTGTGPLQGGGAAVFCGLFGMRGRAEMCGDSAFLTLRSRGVQARSGTTKGLLQMVRRTGSHQSLPLFLLLGGKTEQEETRKCNKDLSSDAVTFPPGVFCGQIHITKFTFLIIFKCPVQGP